MGKFDEMESVPRRVMTLFLLVDTSSSMKGAKIKALNTAIKDTIPLLKDISSSNADAEIKVAVLDFASGSEWMYNGPKKVDDFRWDDLSANGLTDLGDACLELDQKLSTKGFLSEASGSFAPAIILFSDGVPTDNYKKGVNRLKTNNWFKAAVKIAVAIGDTANKDVLAEFAGNKECVLTAHNINQLKKVIRFVSVTASMVASRSASVGGDKIKTKSDEVADLIDKASDSNELGGVDVGTDANNNVDDDWGTW